jgi:hypothetical protein
MKSIAWLAFASVALSASALAAGPVEFEGAVWERGGVALAFDMSVAPGQQRTMTLSGGQTVEMSVDASGQSTVRLLDRAGAELHSATTPADGPNPKKFMYALCRKGAIAYTSPPEKSRSGCP